MDPTQRIDQAFRQLDFAVKLLNFIEKGKLDRAELDVPVEVALSGGKARVDDKIFRDQEDLLKAARHNVNINAGMAAIALDSVYEQANVPPDPRRMEPAEDLRSLVRMIRSAFAKDLIAPKWEVRGRFVRAYRLQLGNVPEEIDLSARDQTPFEFHDIGGLRALVAMKNEVKKVL